MEEVCKHVPNCPQRRVVVIAVPAIHPDNAWPMGRSVWTVVSLIILEKSAEAGKMQWSITQNRHQTIAI